MKKLIFTFIFISSIIFAKDIYVGDRVKLQVSGIPEEKIVESFKNSNLELEKIEKDRDGYVLSIRGFEVGKSTVTLGDKRIVLEIKSSLDEKDKEIYPHLSDNSDTQLYSGRFPYTFVLAIISGILSTLYLLKNFKFRRKESYISPEAKFENVVANLSDDSWDFDLSMGIREYIDSKYQSHFTNGIYSIVGVLTPEDIDTIYNLDNYKFSNNNEDLKERFVEQILEIFNKVRRDTTDV